MEFLRLRHLCNMKILIGVLTSLIISEAGSQTYRQTNFDHTIHGLTTIVSTIQASPEAHYYSGFGSGFFYHKYKKTQSAAHMHSSLNAIDTSLQSIWLVTNKHVLFGRKDYLLKTPSFPAILEFYLRRRVRGQANPVWDTLRINHRDLVNKTKLHIDSSVDVVAIDVTKEVLAKVGGMDSAYYYSAVSEANFPQPDMMVDLSRGTTTGSDVMAIGYPQKFYDAFNLFPTIKAGIIASKWQANYGGKPFFLIDCKLFPGSSGSIVISNYATYSTTDGKEYDWFAFLGVYSGEFYREKEKMELDDMTIVKRESYNTGNVWYYFLIEEIIR